MIAIAAFAFVLRTRFDVTQLGAVGDGKTMCTKAIQRAIDSVGKGVVNVPAGVYLTGSLHLRSHVELHLEKGATLLGSRFRKDYDRALWFSLLIGDKLEDVAITGEGTIDGNGKALAQDVLRLVDTGEVKIPAGGWRPSEQDRVEILELTECHGVRVEGVKIQNACCWVQTYRRCGDLTLKGLRVYSKTYWNNDGFDIVDCRNVRVADCDVDSCDDGICLKSERRDSRCENVLIEHCSVRSSASAIKFGTASYGGFRKVVVKDIRIRDTFRSCVALESVDGGTLEDVLVENVKAVNTGNAFFIRLGHRNLSAPTGRVRNVTLRDFDVQVPAGQPDQGYSFQGPPVTEPHNVFPSSIVGHTEVPIENVQLERINIRMAGGGSRAVADVAIDKVPERPSNYPEVTMFGERPAWALYVRHIKGLTIKELTVTVDKPDYRPPFVADDVSGLTADSVAVHGADPVFMTRLCHDVKLGAGVRVVPR